MKIPNTNYQEDTLQEYQLPNRRAMFWNTNSQKKVLKDHQRNDPLRTKSNMGG